jgi:hypothetical protein
MAVKEHEGFKPGDWVTGSQFERLGSPEAFRPADFPEDVAALQAEIAKTSKTSSKASKAKVDKDG